MLYAVVLGTLQKYCSTYNRVRHYPHSDDRVDMESLADPAGHSGITA